MKVALVTAGGAGMFCGSCMQDNSLVRALRMAGVDAVLVPTYTPIRVDEENASSDRVFLGGINVYLDSVVPGFRYLPRWARAWLDRPSVIRAFTKFGTSTEASGLGALTLDMLKGSAGPQKLEYRQFADYLCDELQPDVIVFSNALLSGILDELKPRFQGQIECLLQGDDVFLEGLSPKWKPQVMQQIQRNCQHFDGFLTHSKYYSDFMANYLQVDRQRIREIPLTVDLSGIPTEDDTLCLEASADSPDKPSTNCDVRIGYFARICPEKGAGNFLQAATKILEADPNVEFALAGFLPQQHQSWFRQRFDDAVNRFPDRIFWLGSPDDRATKYAYLRSFDWLCVPTDYHEPKGLYVLEAAAVGTPSLVPEHGAFPELTQRLGFGQRYDPANSQNLVDALQSVISTTKRAKVATDETRGRNQQQMASALEKHHGMATTGKVVAKRLTSHP